MRMEQGQIVSGLKSKMWIERYAPAGEFKFVADVKSGAKDALPVGSFVSHVDTSEIMVVENHEIQDKKGQDAEIIITGRGFDSLFEQRIVGSNKAFPTSGASAEYELPGDLLWIQVAILISDHILAANLVDPNDQLAYTSVYDGIGGIGAGVSRTLKRGTLYERLQELLAIQSLGIKIVRPGPTSPLGGASPNTAVVVHKGVDRTASIAFSEDTGEIENADYLWSNKLDKNAAMISGRWVETRVVGAETGINRRWMYIDASDLDNNLNAAPAGGDLDLIVGQMQQRGISALAGKNPVALTKAEVAKNATKAAYRRDFDVGDTITVNGSYNVSSKAQISEYVEIEDETGSSGYPTLTVV